MLLEIKGLIKEYKKGFRANDGISLTVERGEVFGLLGPNGAGKSTLVKQIVGLLTPTFGNIILDGIDVAIDPGHARKASSFQPQTDVPIDGLTAIQAIELIGRLRGGNAGAVAERVRQLIAGLEIEEWINKPGQQLSGGVRRLVGYRMATIVPGEIVILDEPTNDIDPLRRRLLWQQIRSLADSGTAVMLVTHNVLEAERAVNRLAIIDKGKVLVSGTTSSLKDTVANNLRLEVMINPGVEEPEVPDFMEVITSGRRLRATIKRQSVLAAVEWAERLQERGTTEEFSVSPISLEDVYVRMIGRQDVLENGKM